VQERNEDEVRRFLNDLLPEAGLSAARNGNHRARKRLELVAGRRKS